MEFGQICCNLFGHFRQNVDGQMVVTNIVPINVHPTFVSFHQGCKDVYCEVSEKLSINWCPYLLRRTWSLASISLRHWEEAVLSVEIQINSLPTCHHAPYHIVHTCTCGSNVFVSTCIFFYWWNAAALKCRLPDHADVKDVYSRWVFGACLQ